MNRLLLFLLVICVACKPAPEQDAGTKPGAGPQFTATVVSIRTTIEPGSKVTSHELVIADGRARSTSEQDVWRLFDTKADTVTTVDDIAKTFRTEPLSSLLQ
ncbi:MAG TPA: hypothetical protein VEU30_03925, partial [Thermoanaerobaculia bacterium]|nr:hypothetical protein [Thermoanaerobaculia bacterium]